MPKTAALQASSADSPFAPALIERRSPGTDDVVIDIKYAGICHSDIHQVRDEWGGTTFPIVPGHEIAGVVSAVGDGVTRFKVGDRVGVGCMVDSCGECEYCKDGQEMFCSGRGTVWTYNSRAYDGEVTLGGYSRQIVVSERFAVRIPDGLGLDVAAPLLCAGITTYSPLKRWGAGPGKEVAVVGLGGLGHMAVKIAAAMDAEVSVVSRSRAKEGDAAVLGAAHYFATNEEGTLRHLQGRFDLIIDTLSADVAIDDYLAMVRPLGALVNVGLPVGNWTVSPGALVSGNRSLAGSNIGGIAETQEMLDFCAAHNLGATVETIGADEVDTAYDRVVAGDVRYRFVIETSTITA